mmetsp:Transcript_45652/g.105970  ORF Transcript_45652/g.105970 Transcript_45652/m.105970 type:complete len:170 (-) Transcript_45652:64-573(-)
MGAAAASCCEVCDDKSSIPEITTVATVDKCSNEPLEKGAKSRSIVAASDLALAESDQGAAASQPAKPEIVASGRPSGSMDREFTVVLPTRGAKMGMVFGISNSERGQVRVRGLKENGFVEQWNQQNPLQAIQVGDSIVNINGAVSAQDMITAVSRNPDEIRIRVRRRVV